MKQRIAILTILLTLMENSAAECAITAPRRDAGMPTYRVSHCETVEELFQRENPEDVGSIRRHDQITERDLALHVEVQWEQQRENGTRDPVENETVHYQGTCSDIPIDTPLNFVFYTPKLQGKYEPYGCCDGEVIGIGCYFDYAIKGVTVSH